MKKVLLQQSVLDVAMALILCLFQIDVTLECYIKGLLYTLHKQQLHIYQYGRPQAKYVPTFCVILWNGIMCIETITLTYVQCNWASNRT